MRPDDKRLRHGKRNTREYACWACMKARCTLPTHADFRNYGGRGITVCQRWLQSFENFLADMGPRPSPKHSIDRRDNDLGYSPDNCRWAIRKVQYENRRTTRWLTLDGETLCMTEWANRSGLSRSTLKERLDKGWSVEAAIKTPPISFRRPLPARTH